MPTGVEHSSSGSSSNQPRPASSLLADLRTAIGQAKEPELQLELTRLHDVLLRCTMPDAWALASAEAALALSRASGPPIAALIEVRNRLDLHRLNCQGGIVPFIRKRLGHSPVYAVFVGTLFSLPLAAFIFFLVQYAERLLPGVTARWDAVAVICLSATFGACVSLIARIDYFGKLYVYDPFLLFLNGLLKPIATSGLALTVYCILLTGIIKVADIHVDPPTDKATLPAKVAASLWVIGFIVGFGERLAQDLISRTEGLFIGTSSQAKPKDQDQNK
jgi:hypothetical protein